MSYDYDSGAGTFIYRDRAQQALNRAHGEPALRSVSVCDLCLAGEGEECHTPGCIYWMNNVPPAAMALPTEGGDTDCRYCGGRGCRACDARHLRDAGYPPPPPVESGDWYGGPSMIEIAEEVQRRRESRPVEGDDDGN